MATTEEVKEAKKKETIYLDNPFIQRYDSNVGKWNFVRSYRELLMLTKKYGVVTLKVKKVNKITDGLKFPEWLFVPYSKDYYGKYLKKGIYKRSITTARGEFIWPIVGSKITSRLGKRWGLKHGGLDIAAASGTLVLAVQHGTIKKSGVFGGYGIAVELEHEQGYITRYAHLSRVLVKPGDKVKKGQVIALSGNSGRSTGPHLHLEVRYHQILLNPENFLPEFLDSMEATLDFQANIFKRLKSTN